MRVTNYNVAAASVVAAALAIPLLAAMMSVVVYHGAEGEGVVILLLGSVGIVIFAAQLFLIVWWVEFADALTVRTLRGKKSYDWDELSSVRFSTETTRVQGVIPLGVVLPLGTHAFLYLNVAGRALKVRIDADEAERVVSLLRVKGKLSLLAT